MKKLLAMLLSCSLMLSCASAETLAEKLGAPEHTTAAYHSATGLSHIYVDAKVVVPEATSVNTYDVAGRDVTAADIRSIVLAANPGTVWGEDWRRANGWTGEIDEPNAIPPTRDDYMVNYIYECSHDEKKKAGSYNWLMKTAFGEKRLLAMASYQQESRYTVKDCSITDLALTDDMALPGQSATLGESRMLAEKIAKAACPDFTLEREGKVPEVEEEDSLQQQTGSQEMKTYAYWFSFTRTLDGLPVTRTNQSALSDYDEIGKQTYATMPRCETLTCVIDQGELVQAEWMNPWQIGEKRMQDVSLMPFEEIMKIFATISPMSIQSQESDMQYCVYENAWYITEIRLGYMPVLLRDGGGQWELRPVWDFMGTFTSGPTCRDEPGNVALTIDAINGTVIDRDYGY